METNCPLRDAKDFGDLPICLSIPHPVQYGDFPWGKRIDAFVCRRGVFAPGPQQGKMNMIADVFNEGRVRFGFDLGTASEGAE